MQAVCVRDPLLEFRRTPDRQDPLVVPLELFSDFRRRAILRRTPVGTFPRPISL